jgi:hypothetical protein
VPLDPASLLASNGAARRDRLFDRDLRVAPLRALARRAGARRRSLENL